MPFKAMIDGEPSSTKPATEPNPSLPYDLVVSCLARVSRLYYPTLSLVSKSFRSLLVSPELYKTRSLLACTESCLYVCLRFPPDSNPNPNPSWFTLSRKLDKTLLAPIQILNSPPVECSSFVAVDHYIYAICGDFEDAPRSNVPFLDCRTHTWLEAPSMRFVHKTSTLFNGKTYLAGSCENPDSFNCVEVFNAKTQTWNPARSQKREFNLRNMEGKIYVKFTDEMGWVCKLKEGTHEMVGSIRDSPHGSICIIDNIRYLYKSIGVFEWLSRKVGGQIKLVKGLEGLLPKFDSYSTVRLVNYGGNLVVLWDRFVSESECKEKMIWCAEISLEKRGSEEIWGKVEWCDVVLTVPSSYEFVYATAATV